MGKIRVLLIEDNRLLREGATTILNVQPDISAVAAGSGNGSMMEKARTLKPHVVLLDAGVSSQNGIRIMRRIQKEFPKAEVVVMDLVPGSSYVMDFVREGASGFVHKDATLDDFLATIRTVAKGQKVLPDNLSGTLFSQIIDAAVQSGDSGRLAKSVRMTPREVEIMELVSLGLSNKEIATKLCLSVHTVKSHIHNILDKLALHTRLELAHYRHMAGRVKDEDRIESPAAAVVKQEG